MLAAILQQLAGVYRNIAQIASRAAHDGQSVVGCGCDVQVEFVFGLDLLVDGSNGSGYNGGASPAGRNSSRGVVPALALPAHRLLRVRGAGVAAIALLDKLRQRGTGPHLAKGSVVTVETGQYFTEELTGAMRGDVEHVGQVLPRRQRVTVCTAVLTSESVSVTGRRPSAAARLLSRSHRGTAAWPQPPYWFTRKALVDGGVS